MRQIEDGLRKVHCVMRLGRVGGFTCQLFYCRFNFGIHRVLSPKIVERNYGLSAAYSTTGRRQELGFKSYPLPDDGYLVEMDGLEPTTFRVQTGRSPD